MNVLKFTLCCSNQEFTNQDMRRGREKCLILSSYIDFYKSPSFCSFPRACASSPVNIEIRVLWICHWPVNFKLLIIYFSITLISVSGTTWRKYFSFFIISSICLCEPRPILITLLKQSMLRREIISSASEIVTAF